MQHITGISRHQMRISSLEDAISPDNQVRFIDAFVNSIELSKLGFEVQTLKSEGRPSYNSQVFLKLYFYVLFWQNSTQLVFTRYKIEAIRQKWVYCR